MTGDPSRCFRKTPARTLPDVAATGAPCETRLSSPATVRMMVSPSAVTTYGRTSSRSRTTRVTNGFVLCWAVRTWRTPLACTVTLFVLLLQIVLGKSKRMRSGPTAVSTVGLTGALTVISMRRSAPCRDVVTFLTVRGVGFCATAPDNKSNAIAKCFSVAVIL